MLFIRNFKKKGGSREFENKLKSKGHFANPITQELGSLKIPSFNR